MNNRYNMPGGMSRHCGKCWVEIPPSALLYCPTCYQTVMLEEQAQKLNTYGNGIKVPTETWYPPINPDWKVPKVTPEEAKLRAEYGKRCERERAWEDFFTLVAAIVILYLAYRGLAHMWHWMHK